VVKPRCGVDEEVRAVAYDSGVADLADLFAPALQALGEVRGVTGSGACAEDWVWGGAFRDAE